LTVYWLDADACIHAKHEETGAFPFSRSQRFWDYLSKKVDEGVVQCPKMVYDEIVAGKDHLAEWFREREQRGLCVHPSDQVWDALTEVSDFVVNRYKDRKSRKFLNGADAMVIAHAKAMGSEGVLVSQDSLSMQDAIVKIPAVCAAFGIEKISWFQMLNRLGDYRG
jgi:hypothetical protein